MRVIIAGSRDIHDYDLLERTILASGFEITEVLSGTQRGVDKMGERWSREVLHKAARLFPPRSHTESAYRERNLAMAREAEALIAIPGPARTSSVDGTKNMIMHALAHGLKIFIPEVE